MISEQILLVGDKKLHYFGNIFVTFAIMPNAHNFYKRTKKGDFYMVKFQPLRDQPSFILHHDLKDQLTEWQF